MEEAGMSLPNINVVPSADSADSQKSQQPDAGRFAQLAFRFEEKLQKQLDKALMPVAARRRSGSETS